MSNKIHETAIIEDGVIIGENNSIGPFCLIKKGVIIGDNNEFEGYCSIGTTAEHKNYFKKDVINSVVIGNDNTFREFVTINGGTENNTLIGNNIIILRGAHVGHDSIIYDNVILSCNVLIGGHSTIMEGVNMGLGSMCHQFSVLGPYSMIGMGGIVTKKSKIEPFNKYVGNPVRLLGENLIALERNNITKEARKVIEKEYFRVENKLKKITIIIPCFGRPERTKRIIQNVLDQDMNDWEAFIIGDGCPSFQNMIDDGSILKYQKKAKEKNSNLVMFNMDKNYGGYGYKILDYAMTNSTGEYIIFAGNDDILKPNHFRHYLSEVDDFDLVAYPTFVGPLNSIRKPLFTKNFIGHSEIIVKSELIKEYLHTNEYGHDWELLNYILKKTNKVKISNNLDYTYIVTHISNKTIDKID